MTESDIEKEVTGIVAEITEMEEAEIWEKRDANFYKDLAIDSLLALEILAMIEKKYKIQIPEDKLADINSLSSTIELTKSVLAQGGKL